MNVSTYSIFISSLSFLTTTTTIIIIVLSNQVTCLPTFYSILLKLNRGELFTQLLVFCSLSLRTVGGHGWHGAKFTTLSLSRAARMVCSTRTWNLSSILLSAGSYAWHWALSLLVSSTSRFFSWPARLRFIHCVSRLFCTIASVSAEVEAASRYSSLSRSAFFSSLCKRWFWIGSHRTSGN